MAQDFEDVAMEFEDEENDYTDPIGMLEYEGAHGSQCGQWHLPILHLS